MEGKKGRERKGVGLLKLSEDEGGPKIVGRVGGEEANGGPIDPFGLFDHGGFVCKEDDAVSFLSREILESLMDAHVLLSKTGGGQVNIASIKHVFVACGRHCSTIG